MRIGAFWKLWKRFRVGNSCKPRALPSGHPQAFLPDKLALRNCYAISIRKIKLAWPKLFWLPNPAGFSLTREFWRFSSPVEGAWKYRSLRPVSWNSMFFLCAEQRKMRAWPQNLLTDSEKVSGKSFCLFSLKPIGVAIALEFPKAYLSGSTKI